MDVAPTPERTLVISVDGLLASAVTADLMPNLWALAGSGGSCFEAVTVAPPITVPAHASMLRGVDTAVHGLVDNTPIPPDTDARSFLQLARQAGLATGSVVCWPPLDQLIEADAVTHRRPVGTGYGRDDDRLIAAATADLLTERRLDVVFTYLVLTDLAGHVTGWDSRDYRLAASEVDDRLGELIAAAGDEWAVLVTTDHGGVGNDHHDPHPITMRTFVVLRSRRVAPGTRWSTASILDVAPTVADLLGLTPDPAWTGRSLVTS